MSNSQLYNKTYKIPSEIITSIGKVLVSHSTGDGVKRAKFIVRNGSLTYQAMKRLKNFFDTYNPQSGDRTQFELAGGEPMKVFIERTLVSERDGVSRSADIKRDMSVDLNNNLKAYNAKPNLNEEESGLKKNALAIIVNADNKFLLLKRSDEPKQWMPNKWALVGGGVEKGESPDTACKREIFEETGLDIDRVIKKYSIQRNPDSIEHVFICRYDGDSEDIKLNPENSGYGWYNQSELEFLDVVPNLIDYISLAFKEYD